jgi:transcriptional regulator with XRE-family HTH domain
VETLLFLVSTSVYLDNYYIGTLLKEDHMEESYSELLELLSSQLKERRLELNLTEEYVSKEVGISVKNLKLLEQGSFSPKLKTLNKLCNILNYSIEDLLKNVETREFEQYSQHLNGSIRDLHHFLFKIKEAEENLKSDSDILLNIPTTVIDNSDEEPDE